MYAKPKAEKKGGGTGIRYYRTDVITKWMNYEHRLNEREDKREKMGGKEKK